MQISVMQSRQQMHLVPGPILQNPAHSSQLSDTSMSPGITAGTPLQVTLCLSPGFTYFQVVIQYYTKAGTPFQLSLWSSPGFTSKQYSIPSQLVVTTWLYTKAVLHSKSACGHHLALHQSSTPFQVSLRSSPGFTPKQYSIPISLSLSPGFTPKHYSIPISLSLSPGFTPKQYSIPISLLLSPGFRPKQYSIPSQLEVITCLVSHQSSTPFQVSLQSSPGFTPKQYSIPSQLVVVTWLYTKAVLHSKSACGCHLALHQSSIPFQVSLWLSPGFTPKQYSIPISLSLSPGFTPKQYSIPISLSLSPGFTPKQYSIPISLSLSPGFTPKQYSIPISLSLSPGFTPKQYSIPSQPAVITWLYTKAVLHSKSACGHHLASHQSSTPFQVSLRSSPGFTPKQYSIPSQLVVITWLYIKAVLHSKSACGHHLALHQSCTPFQVSLSLLSGFTPQQYSIPTYWYVLGSPLRRNVSPGLILTFSCPGWPGW